MTSPPDWAIAVPSTPGVHPSGTALDQFTRPFTQAQLIQLGVQFLEQFLKRVVLALTGSFIPGGGTAFSQLEKYGEDLLNGTLLDDLFFGTGGAAGHYPPYSVPFTPSHTSQTAQFMALLQRFLNWGDITSSGFDFEAAIRSTLDTLKSTGLIPDLVNGQIPLDQIPEDLLNLFKQLIGLFTPGITIPTAPVDIITTLFNAFFGFFGITTAAQSQATTAATQAAANTAAINVITTGGAAASVTDLEFNTAPTVNISANYTTLYIPGSGGAGGALAADGLGAVQWQPSGNLTRTGYARHVTALGTDNFDAQLILDSAIPAPVGGGQCYVWILARVGSTLGEFVALRIGYNSVVIGDAPAFSSGNFTARSAPVAITSGADSLIFRGGYTASGWEFKLLQNNSTVIDFTDTGHNSLLDGSHRGVGFGLTAPNSSTGSQLMPPKILSFTASDRLASAP